MRLFQRVYEWVTDRWYGRCEKVVQECAVCAASGGIHSRDDEVQI